MTDCTKCIHEQICDQTSRLMWSAMAKEEKCSDFKDRAEYVKVRYGTWDSFGVRRRDAKGRNRIEYMFNACTLCENPAVKRTAFCPNCGAKMDAEVHDDA